MTIWREQIRTKRKKLHLTQDQVALRVGITARHLRRLEKGERQPSVALKKNLTEVLNNWIDDPELTLLIDYVRIRFPTRDYLRIITEVLELDKNKFYHEPFAYFGYHDMYVYANLQVMIAGPDDHKRGVLLELKGKGCRIMESILLVHNQTWYDLFRRCLAHNGVFKRLDLAINDLYGLINIPELIDKCEHDECISVMRHFEGIRSGMMTNSTDDDGIGSTLYIGSQKSDIYFCLYEKAKEQIAKRGAEADLSIVNRLEIRLKNERARAAIDDLLIYRDPERTAFGIIKRYIRFVDRRRKLAREDWPLNRRWVYFCGKNRQPLRLTVKPEPIDLEKTRTWIRKQVAPMLNVLFQIDGYYGKTTTMEDIRQANLTDKHQKLIKQHTIIKDSLEGTQDKQVNSNKKA